MSRTGVTAFIIYVKASADALRAAITTPRWTAAAADRGFRAT